MGPEPETRNSKPENPNPNPSEILRPKHLISRFEICHHTTQGLCVSVIKRGTKDKQLTTRTPEPGTQILSSNPFGLKLGAFELRVAVKEDFTPNP